MILIQKKKGGSVVNSSVQRLARCGVLTALALALSAAESLVPLTILFPLPGLRLGLSNLVTLYALCRLSRREALLILVARCLLGGLLRGNLTALAFSVTGGVLALAVMIALGTTGKFSLLGLSVAGAAAHNCGQILAAIALLGSAAPLIYLPPLLLASVVTGGVTGGLVKMLIRRLPPITPSHRDGGTEFGESGLPNQLK